MCGITGFIDYQKSISEEDLLNASAALRHRGGNGNGHIYEIEEKYRIGLANERLATIDTSNGGIQPFTSSCGNYTITFNGTIYNYIELRADLIKYGVTFKTLSDTEVLLESYKKWGHQLFSKIDGAFAFAILDRKQKQLFVARDTMGVKPLYFYKDQHFFAFSSEIKSMFQYPINKKINLDSLGKYFRCGYFFGESTIFENIWSFKKQHYFVIDLYSGNHLERKFENTETDIAKIPTSEAEIIDRLQELVIESVLKRSVADVNIGVMLSGGYDSATVAAILQKNQTKKIKTFTLGFKHPGLNEANDAKAIAKHLNTNHKEYYIDDEDAISMLEKIPAIFDEPMGDSGAIPLAFLVKQVANEGIKVILGAEGGDELFAGYTNYKKSIWLHQKSNQLPSFLKRMAITFSGNRKHKLAEILYSKSLIGAYEALTSSFANHELSTLLNQKINPIITLEAGINDIKTLLDFDLDNYLPNDLLLKSDRIAMHYGIDNRDALLNTQLVNTLNKVDTKWLMPKGNLKHLLKSITHQYIPKKLMDRPKKGFSIPITEWMSTIYRPYVEEYLSNNQLAKHNLFNSEEIARIRNRFYLKPSGNDAKKLWLLLQFQMWHHSMLQS